MCRKTIIITPDTGAVDKLVASALIPIGRPTIGFQNQFVLKRIYISLF
jgi:hypothetical protein